MIEDKLKDYYVETKAFGHVVGEWIQAYSKEQAEQLAAAKHRVFIKCTSERDVRR